MYYHKRFIKEKEDEMDKEFVFATGFPPDLSKLTDRFGHSFCFVNAGNLWLPPLNIGSQNDYFSHLKQIREMNIRDSDILICSYPKSGLHWHLEIITMLLNGTTQYTDKETFDKTYLEFHPASHHDEQDSDKPRIFHTHLPFGYLPKQVLEKETKIIHLVRNPKDVMVSLYCQVYSVLPPFNYTGTFQQFVFLVLECGYHNGAVFEYLMGFQDGLEEHPDVPVLTSIFEDVKNNPVESVKTLNQFLGTGRGQGCCQQIAEACDFHRIKKYKEANSDNFEQMVFCDRKSGFYRKGDVGDWKNWFTVALSEVFDDQIEKRMQGYKLSFQYQ